MKLRLLHINESDAGGGAARSGRRIHDGLRKRGHESRMLVGRRLTDDPDVRRLKRNAPWRAADRPFAAAWDALDLQYLFYPSSLGVALDPWFREADAVALYNTHGSYFSVTALPLLTRRKPLVWRLSDMWPFTGHVAYSFDCDRWRHGCGSCPYLREYPPLDRDTTAFLWRVKRLAYRHSRLTLVAPSRWMERTVRESPLLGRFPVRHVPNGVDLDTFRPRAKEEARRALGLDPARPVVYFAAVRMDDRRKGAAVLVDALRRLADVDFQLLVSGNEPPAFGRAAHDLGPLAADEELALAYAAADVYVLPTLAENLPNVAVESLACGTPVVAFDVGGVPDAVRHLETGYLAPLGDAEELARGIRELVGDTALRERLSRTCREVAERDFADTLEAERFEDVLAEAAGR